jgi:hypothetical protein
MSCVIYHQYALTQSARKKAAFSFSMAMLICNDVNTKKRRSYVGNKKEYGQLKKNDLLLCGTIKNCNKS